MTRISECAPRRGALRRFLGRDDGNATIELVLWFPMVIMLVALVINVSIMFYSQNEVLRAIQDGNRNLSIGRFDNALETETYIESRLVDMMPHVNARSTITAGVVTTVVTYPASDMLFFNLFQQFNRLTLSARADHLIEDWEA